MATLVPPVSRRPAAVSSPRLVLTTVQKLALPTGTLLFDWLFWQHQAGLNLVLYTSFVLVVVLGALPRYAPVWRSGYLWATLGGTWLSGTLVVLYGSGAARLACVASLAMVLGYVNQPHLKLVVYALLTALGNLARVVPELPRLGRLPSKAGGRLARARFYGRLVLLPLLALLVFHLLFTAANPRYSAAADVVLGAIGDWAEWLLASISLSHLLFLLLGFLLTAGAVVLVPVHFFADHESGFGEFVLRQRNRVASFAVRRPDFRPQTFRLPDLRKEYLMALVLLGLVNALLLGVNAIDINWFWFGYEPRPGENLTQFVHEGTYVLILSILVAMGIVLWFFRRNLNFYQPGLRALRVGATVWVVQNAVLAVSVGLRNYYYILHTGLAYKRIGVYGFLLLTLFGLGTVLLKIWQRRSAYSLVRLNALAAYAVLLLLAAGNWEIWIAEYNLQPRFRGRADLEFLLEMPGRVLPVLHAHRPYFEQLKLKYRRQRRLRRLSYRPHFEQSKPNQTARFHELVPKSGTSYAADLDRATAQWLADYRQRSWQSWNYADHRAYDQLKIKN